MRRAIAAGAACAVLLTASACSAPKGDAQDPPAAPSASHNEDQLPAGWAEFRAALAKIDPRQSERRDRPVLYDVENTCSDLSTKDEATVLVNVGKRFEVDAAKSKQIVAAIKEHIDCGAM